MDDVSVKFRGSKLLSLGCCVATLGLCLTATAQQTDGESSFRSSVRSAFEQDLGNSKDGDITKEFLLRTVDAIEPKLNTDIPLRRLREEGPRIIVNSFNFIRLEEYPSEGITRTSVEALAESLRREYMKEEELVAGNYSKKNLVEIADFLTSVGAQEKANAITAKDLQQLVNLVKVQNSERGLSYVDLEDIAARLTDHYRQQGLFLAQVQIPAQEVSDGVVALTVQEGLLGRVVVEDNKKYSEKSLSAPFAAQRNSLVNHRQVEEGLYLLNDLPGLNVTGYFSAGENPGETALHLKVRDEQAVNFAFRTDNHGSTFTGDKRTYAIVDWLNPVGVGDALTLGFLKSYTPDNSDLGQLKYSLPVFGARTRFELGLDYNKFKLSDGEDGIINRLAIEGVNRSYSMSLDHKWRRSRDFNLSTAISITDKETDTDAAVVAYRNKTHVRGADLGIYIDSLAEVVEMLNMVNLKVQYGEHLTPVLDGRGEDFYKTALNTNSLFFVPLPFTDARSRLILKLHGQYSDKSLPAFEQISLGGANGVRAFSVREFSGDQGAVVSAEWFIDLPEFLNANLSSSTRLNDVFQFGLIADAGYGALVNYEAESSNSWARLAGAGIVMKLSWQEMFAAQVSVAHPVMSQSSIEALGDDAESAQVFADFTFFFQ